MLGIKKDISKKQIDRLIPAAGRLKKVSADEYSGWGDYVQLLNNYVDGVLEYKKNFNLSSATEEEIQQLKYYDRDVWIINNFVKKLPFMFISNLTQAIEAAQREEDKK